MTQKVQGLKAMIFAAGIGSRLKPLTDTKPKALVEFNGKTLLEYAILKLKFYGYTDIIVNTHHFSSQIIEYISNNDFGVSISISDESEELLNTGGGLCKVKDFFSDNKPFLVYNVDIISTINLFELYDFHMRQNALVSLAVCDRETSRYLLFDSSNQLCAWENRQTSERKIINERDSYEPLAFSGIQMINPQIFSLICETGKFPIMDLYLRLAKTEKILAYNHTNDFWLDVGKFNQYEELVGKLSNHQLEFVS